MQPFLNPCQLCHQPYYMHVMIEIETPSQTRSTSTPVPSSLFQSVGIPSITASRSGAPITLTPASISQASSSCQVAIQHHFPSTTGVSSLPAFAPRRANAFSSSSSTMKKPSILHGAVLFDFTVVFSPRPVSSLFICEHIWCLLGLVNKLQHFTLVWDSIPCTVCRISRWVCCLGLATRPSLAVETAGQHVWRSVGPTKAIRQESDVRSWSQVWEAKNHCSRQAALVHLSGLLASRTIGQGSSPENRSKPFRNELQEAVRVC